MHFDKNALKVWDERKARWTAEARKFNVLVGESAASLLLEGEIELGKTLA